MESTLRLELLLFITHAKHSAWSSWARLYRSVKLACFLFTAHQTDLQFQRKPQTFSTIITCVKSPSMNWKRKKELQSWSNATQKQKINILCTIYKICPHFTCMEVCSSEMHMEQDSNNTDSNLFSVLYFQNSKLQAWYILHSLNPINHSRFQYSCNCCFLLFVLFSVFIPNFEWIFSDTSCAICWACLARQAG